MAENNEQMPSEQDDFLIIKTEDYLATDEYNGDQPHHNTDSTSTMIDSIDDSQHIVEVFVCFVCGERCDSELACVEHCAAVHGLVVVCCPVCQQKFLSEILLQQHINTLHTAAATTSQHSKRCRRPSRYQTDEDFVLSNTGHKAKRCHKVSVKTEVAPQLNHGTSNDEFGNTTSSGIVCDLIVTGSEGKEEIDVNTKQQQCPVCNRVLGSIHKLQRHMGLHERQYVCSQCNQQFKTATNLQRHLSLHSSERPYLCPDCGQTFRVAENLALHRRTHSTVRAFTCTHCPATYKRRDKLREHILLKHETDKLLACAQCDKKFVAPYQLRDHLRMHGDVREFPCDVCPKSFHSKIKLDAHRRQTHREVLPGTVLYDELQCSECGRVLSCRASLAAHLRRHAGVYPYTCGDCHKSFVSRSELTLHLPTHTTAKPFSCSVCAAAFKHKKTLQKHKLNHSHSASELRVQCKFCGDRFRTDSAMYTHRRKYHSTTGDNNTQDTEPSAAAAAVDDDDDDDDRLVIGDLQVEHWQLTEVTIS